MLYVDILNFDLFNFSKKTNLIKTGCLKSWVCYLGFGKQISDTTYLLIFTSIIAYAQNKLTIKRLFTLYTSTNHDKPVKKLK